MPTGVYLHSRIPAEERFWAKVKRGPGCWLWLGSKSRGYGYFAGPDRVNIPVHRFAYELLVGPIPDALTIDHLCHNADANCKGGPTCPHRACVRPAHLEPVTFHENVRRGAARKESAPCGHPYTASDHSDGTARRCRSCRNARQRLMWSESQARQAGYESS